MIRILFAACLCVWMAACAKPSGDNCQASADVMLEMTFIEFDQGVDGWRSLDASLACSDHADDVLAEYRSLHGASLTPANVSLLIWHEAQVLAAKGDVAKSADLMREAAFPGEPQWQQLYREGSIAFLQGDLAGLEAAKNSLARLPRDPSLITFGGTEAAWPPNLDVLEGLISCFGKPYSVAYACRRPPAS